MGVSGRIARFFLESRLTPLIALVALLLGGFAVLVTPREEEPQINVTMANVLIPFPGASARDVESLVATPAEQVIAQIQGLEHVFSISKPGLAIVTAQFKVGVPRTDALVRLYDTVFSNRDWLPKELGVGEPLIKPKGIDDVPIVTLTLWTPDATRGAFDLERVAHALEADLKRVPGTREVTTVGGPGRVVRVLLDPQRLAAFRLAAGDIRQALLAANSSLPSGALVADNRVVNTTCRRRRCRPRRRGPTNPCCAGDGACRARQIRRRRSPRPARRWDSSGLLRRPAGQSCFRYLLRCR